VVFSLALRAWGRKERANHGFAREANRIDVSERAGSDYREEDVSMKRVILALVPVLMLMSTVVAGRVSAQDDAATTIKIANDPNLGAIFTDANGMTLYLFTKDTTEGQSSCTGDCLANWPAVPGGDALTLPAGVPGELTSIDRGDGTTQAAYNGIPLYTFANDKAPGDVNGQGVGDKWYVVYPGASFGPYAAAPGDGTPVPASSLHVGFTEELGPFLTDSKGMTLYLFTKDTTAGQSACSGDCLANWPALAGSANDMLPVGIQGTLSTFDRGDGTMQLAYNDIPLYYFHNDTKAGDTNGQEVGDVWYVVTPGMKLGDPPHESEAEGTPTS